MYNWCHEIFDPSKIHRLFKIKTKILIYSFTFYIKENSRTIYLTTFRFLQTVSSFSFFKNIKVRIYYIRPLLLQIEQPSPPPLPKKIPFKTPRKLSMQFDNSEFLSHFNFAAWNVIFRLTVKPKVAFGAKCELLG